jgi:hypothetical protein
MLIRRIDGPEGLASRVLAFYAVDIGKTESSSLTHDRPGNSSDAMSSRNDN